MSVNELSLFINTNDRDKLMSVNELSLFINTNDRDTLMSVNELSLLILYIEIHSNIELYIL
jgi:hypothetical protein